MEEYGIEQLIEEIKEMWLYLDFRIINEVIMVLFSLAPLSVSFAHSEYLAHSWHMMGDPWDQGISKVHFYNKIEIQVFSDWIWRELKVPV